MNDSHFWRFSIGFYAVPGVAQHCIELQDQAGVDVNVLFFVLYLASRGHAVDAPVIVKIEQCVQPWRDAVVIPLRAVRRRLRAAIGAFDTSITAPLRNEVKRIELAAERLQQEALERALQPESFRASSATLYSLAHANALAYLQHIGAPPGEQLESILRAFTQHVSAKPSSANRTSGSHPVRARRRSRPRRA